MIYFTPDKNDYFKSVLTLHFMKAAILDVHLIGHCGRTDLQRAITFSVEYACEMKDVIDSL